MDISEELQKRLNQKPDQWTLAWWEERFQEVLKGYRGATHGINRSLAEYEDACKAIGELRSAVTQLQQDREADRAKIGELQARVERHAEFLTTLKTERKNSEANKEQKNGEATHPVAR